MNQVPQNHHLSQILNRLSMGISFISVLVGLVVLKSSNTSIVLTRAIVHYTSQPAIINLIIAIAALFTTLLSVWRKSWQRPAVTLIFIITVAVTGMFASLLCHDDYIGGSCGEFDWPSGHLHAGYPYSWLDGHICIAPHTSLGEYTRQHPEKATWYPDFLALPVDLLFWINIGILMSVGARLVYRLLPLRMRRISKLFKFLQQSQ